MAAAALLGGLLAFGMLLAELRVVQLASSLSLAVAGILKEVLTVLASATLLGEPLSASNALGLSTRIAGEWRAAVNYSIVERSPALAARQRLKFRLI